MLRLPFRLPGEGSGASGPGSAVITNDGGYDVTIAGLGFRLANDTQFPYLRESEQMSSQKFNTSNEPGEQSLAELPWYRQQSSFHGGAGQKNLETAYTAFQYLQEQIQHVRFDTCQLCDIWTPGKVTRLPDSIRRTTTANSQQIVTATVSGVDYAVVGGPGVFYLMAWTGGPDALPTVTNIDMSSATFGGISNCTITSLATDGLNYYAVVQLAVQGSTPGILTYIITGSMDSFTSPTVLYEAPNYTTFQPRTNLCTNPSFETNTTGWAGGGTPLPTIAQSATQAYVGTQSLKVTSPGTPTSFPAAASAMTGLPAGAVYTCSAYVYLQTPFSGSVTAAINGVQYFGSATATTGSWKRISITFTATSTSHTFLLYGNGFTTGQFFYVDAVLIEQAGSVGSYFDGATTADAIYTYSWTSTANASTSLATPI